MPQARYLKILLLSALVFAGLLNPATNTHAAFSHDPDIPWSTLTTQNFLIHFQKGNLQQAKSTAEICERVHKKLTEYFNWIPSQPTHVVIIEQNDIANGFAVPLPRNTMTLHMTPSDDLSSDFPTWLEHLITHEYTHVLHVDKVSGWPANLRNLFGRFTLLFPNALQPAWILEGLATYKETDQQLGFGRGQSSLFEMYMRIESQQGFKPIRQVNLPIISWPGGMTRYLYGAYFFNFLKDTYGEEKIKLWIDSYSDNLLPFWINHTAQQVFGKDLFDLWRDFEVYIKKAFQPGIDSIQAAGIREGQRITSSAYVTGYPRITANGDVYYIKNDLASQAMLMRRTPDSAAGQEIMEVHGSQFDVHPEKGILLTELDYVDNVKPYFDLYVANLDGSDKHRITTAGRYKYATWHPTEDKILAVQFRAGRQSLQLLSGQGEVVETLWQANDETMVTHPRWSPAADRIVASVWRPDSKWNIETFTITTRRWQKITNTNNIEFRPVFSADGRKLYFIADYAETYNAYVMDLGDKTLQQLSNVSSGTLAAEYNPREDAIYYMGTHAEGSDLYRLDLKTHKPTVVVAPKFTPYKDSTESLPALQTEIDTSATTDYDPFPYIAPTYWLPYFFVDDDREEYGFTTNANDPLQRHQYSFSGGYDTKNSWSTGRVEYFYDRYNPSVKLSAERLVTIEKQNIIQKRIFTEDEFAAEFLFPHLTRDIQWVFHAGWVRTQIKDQKRTSGLPMLGDLTDELLGLGVSINSAKSFQRSISPVSGSRIRIVAEDNDAFDHVFTGQTYQLDWRQYFALGGKHVLATRLLFGWGTDIPRPFRLGGNIEGYALVHPALSLPVPTAQIFNQRKFALRGYDNTPGLTNRRLLLGELEWRFPLLSIERTLSLPPIGINRVHGRLFFNTGETVADHYNTTALHNGAGAELIAELVIFYGIPLNLRIGFAEGFDDEGISEWYAALGNTF